MVMTVSLSPAYVPLTMVGVVVAVIVPPRIVNNRSGPAAGSIVSVRFGSLGIANVVSLASAVAHPVMP